MRKAAQERLGLRGKQNSQQGRSCVEEFYELLYASLFNASYLIKGGELDSWDLKKWRKKHGFNQFEAAEKLGINRGGFQNWEREVRPISKAVELACQEISRLSQQRPDFGPVILVYADRPILQQSDETYSVALLRCDRHPNNETAIEEACQLGLDPLLGNPFILAEDGSVIWDTSELLDECYRRSCAKLE